MEIQPHHTTKDGWSRIGYTRPPQYPHPPHQQYTHTHRQRSRPRLNGLLYLHLRLRRRGACGDWKNSPTAGSGRIHPPPAAQDVPGRARNACSSGCSRSGALGASIWGLEEFTHICTSQGCSPLSLPVTAAGRALGVQPQSAHTLRFSRQVQCSRTTTPTTSPYQHTPAHVSTH